MSRKTAYQNHIHKSDIQHGGGIETLPPADSQYEINSYSDQTYFSDFDYGMLSTYQITPMELRQIMDNPMVYNQELRRLSMRLYSSNGAYTNTVDYMTAMPTLDSVIVPYGDDADKKQQNKALMKSTLKTIKDKEFVRDALFKGMVKGIAFYYFETTTRPYSRAKYMSDYDVRRISEINEAGINASIISLPEDYTQIVGMKNGSYVIAFNLEYFDSIEDESRERKLKKYPKEIRDAYKKRGTSGKWVVLDSSKTIVHKIRSERSEKWGRPLVLAAIGDINYNDYFTNTKRNVLDEINNRIIYQTYPEGKEKGLTTLTKRQQKDQHDSVKSAVLNKNNRGGISFFSVAAGTKINSLSVDNTDIFDDKNESNLNNKIAMDLGIASSLLNGVGSGSYSAQQQNLELITAQLFQWIEQIESELNKCIAANIIKDAKNPVELHYLPMTHVNKKTMVENAKNLYLQGRGSLSLWASACGIAPDVFYALLDEELELGIETKYPVHATSFNTSGNEAGRPETDEPTENTMRSRSNNGNEIPTPSDS